MREIKFKIWDKEKNRMFVPDLIINNNTLPNSLVAMQYTGLKDENGVDIYEGDIVKGNYLRRVGVVEWNKYFCKFDISHRMNISPSDELEVIGNIYENPELLKGE